MRRRKSRARAASSSSRSPGHVPANGEHSYRDQMIGTGACARWMGVETDYIVYQIQRTRLDAHREPSIEPPLQRGRSPLTKRLRLSEVFDQRLTRLAHRIDQEIDRVTAERLRADLQEKMQRAAA